MITAIERAIHAMSIPPEHLELNLKNNNKGFDDVLKEERTRGTESNICMCMGSNTRQDTASSCNGEQGYVVPARNDERDFVL